MFFWLAYFATFAFHSCSFTTEGQPLNPVIGHKRLHAAKHSYFPQTWDKHVKTELKANQRRTQMNLLSLFSTETWALLLLFIALVVAWVKHSLLVFCSCHFAVLAIVHFHATSLLKSKRVGVIARFPSSNEALEVAEESKDCTDPWSCSKVRSIPVHCYNLAAKHQSNNWIIMVPGIRYQQSTAFSEACDPLGYFPQKYNLRKAVPPWLRLPYGGEQAVDDPTAQPAKVGSSRKAPEKEHS